MAGRHLSFSVAIVDALMSILRMESCHMPKDPVPKYCDTENVGVEEWMKSILLRMNVYLRPGDAPNS